jgi:hypothetical protein
MNTDGQCLLCHVLEPRRAAPTLPRREARHRKFRRQKFRAVDDTGLETGGKRQRLNRLKGSILQNFGSAENILKFWTDRPPPQKKISACIMDISIGVYGVLKSCKVMTTKLDLTELFVVISAETVS